MTDGKAFSNVATAWAAIAVLGVHGAAGADGDPHCGDEAGRIADRLRALEVDFDPAHVKRVSSNELYEVALWTPARTSM